jgi:uracil-DNA glycosylase
MTYASASAGEKRRAANKNGISLARLLRDIGRCQACAAHLPLGPRPVLHAAKQARLLIVGQAPGRKVHESGIPWDDASGERLRSWMDVTAATFYDKTQIAIVPMGFCYPGKAKGSGDKPPRPECAALWHEQIFEHLPQVELTLLVGQYAQRHYLGPNQESSLTETVKSYAQYGPAFIPLPHPSWRSAIWAKRNPWFELEVIPSLRRAIRKALG